MTYHAKVAADGTIVIPAELLEAFGIKHGDSLMIERAGRNMVVTRGSGEDGPLTRLREAMKGYSVDQFLDDRRADWSE